MGARFLSSTGLGSGNLIGRAQFPPAPALDKNWSPISVLAKVAAKMVLDESIPLDRKALLT